MMELIKSILAPEWNYDSNYFLKSSIIKHIHIF